MKLVVGSSLQQRYNFRFASNYIISLSLPPMKLIAFIMALLVLVLSLLPCVDNTFAMKADKAKTELTNSTHQQDEPHEDACSPFCICSCCAGFSIFYPFAKIEIAALAHKPAYTSFLAAQVFEVSLPIWQPPQLA